MVIWGGGDTSIECAYLILNDSQMFPGIKKESPDVEEGYPRDFGVS